MATKESETIILKGEKSGAPKGGAAGGGGSMWVPCGPVSTPPPKCGIDGIMVEPSVLMKTGKHTDASIAKLIELAEAYDDFSSNASHIRYILFQNHPYKRWEESLVALFMDYIEMVPICKPILGTANPKEMEISEIESKVVEYLKRYDEIYKKGTSSDEFVQMDNECCSMINEAMTILPNKGEYAVSELKLPVAALSYTRVDGSTQTIRPELKESMMSQTRVFESVYIGPFVEEETRLVTVSGCIKSKIDVHPSEEGIPSENWTYDDKGNVRSIRVVRERKIRLSRDFVEEYQSVAAYNDIVQLYKNTIDAMEKTKTMYRNLYEKGFPTPAQAAKGVHISYAIPYVPKPTNYAESRRKLMEDVIERKDTLENIMNAYGGVLQRAGIQRRNMNTSGQHAEVVGKAIKIVYEQYAKKPLYSYPGDRLDAKLAVQRKKLRHVVDIIKNMWETHLLLRRKMSSGQKGVVVAVSSLRK